MYIKRIFLFVKDYYRLREFKWNISFFIFLGKETLKGNVQSSIIFGRYIIYYAAQMTICVFIQIFFVIV